MNRRFNGERWRARVADIQGLGNRHPGLRKWAVTALLLIIIYYAATSIAAYLSAPRIEMTMSPLAGRVAVAVKPAKKGTIEQKVTYTGSVLPYFSTAMIPRTGGWLKEIHVDAGDRVTEGQLLVRLDKRELETKLEDRRAHRVFMSQEHERNKKLLEAGAISQSEFDRSKAMYDQAKAEEENAATQLSYTDIAAPFDGVVTDREKLINLGEYVQPGTHLMMLARTDRMRVQVRVAEKDAPFIKVGTKVTVRFPNLPEKYQRISAAVSTVIPRLDPATRTATVEVVVDNPERLIRTDMYAMVDLVLRQKPDAIIIPRQSVLEVEGKPSVFVTDSVVAMRRDVKLGIASGDRVEVLEGVKEGEMVIEKGQRGLTDFQEINIVEGI